MPEEPVVSPIFTDGEHSAISSDTTRHMLEKVATARRRYESGATRTLVYGNPPVDDHRTRQDGSVDQGHATSGEKFSRVMCDEIFGPILPVVTVRNVEEAIAFINVAWAPTTVHTRGSSSVMPSQYCANRFVRIPYGSSICRYRRSYGMLFGVSADEDSKRDILTPPNYQLVNRIL